MISVRCAVGVPIGVDAVAIGDLGLAVGCAVRDAILLLDLFGVGRLEFALVDCELDWISSWAGSQIVQAGFQALLKIEGSVITGR